MINETLNPLMNNTKDSFNGKSEFAKLTRTPSSDLPKFLKKTLRTSRSRLSEAFNKPDFIKLPKLTDVTPDKVEGLIINKLKQCSIIFDSNEQEIYKRQRKIKDETLEELIDYFSTYSGFLTPSIYQTLVEMYSINIFRSTPEMNNSIGEFDSDEQETSIIDDEWDHIQLVYELFLKFLELPDFKSSVAKLYIDKNFVANTIELIKSEDIREREYLKTILHRIYGKIVSLRSFFRKYVKNVFISTSFETNQVVGISELLEVLGSIINGFALPLKGEHISFLKHSLIYLHIPRNISLYHSQLTYCILQYIEKDPSLADFIISKLIKYWPRCNSPKEILFLNELEDILYVLDDETFSRVYEKVFQQYSKCICSPQFQVAEKALTIWSVDRIYNLISTHSSKILPIIFESIYRSSQVHWHEAIKPMAWYSLKIYRNIDEKVFYKLIDEYEQKYNEQESNSQSGDEATKSNNELENIIKEVKRKHKREYYKISKTIVDRMIEYIEQWQSDVAEDDDNESNSD